MILCSNLYFLLIPTLDWINQDLLTIWCSARGSITATTSHPLWLTEGATTHHTTPEVKRGAEGLHRNYSESTKIYQWKLINHSQTSWTRLKKLFVFHGSILLITLNRRWGGWGLAKACKDVFIIIRTMC